jgi:hypothetical protein
MSKAVQVALITIGALTLAAVLLLVGINLGRAQSADASRMLDSDAFAPNVQMMGSSHAGGMMTGYGMMGSSYYGGLMSGHRMMGAGSFGSIGLLGVDPLSISESKDAVERYLVSLGDEDLVIGEVMIFDNHSYVQVIEQSTGIGAFELLVDPVTLAVTPEHGPTMMWNLKYSPMMGFQGFGMMGIMSSGFDEGMTEMMSDESPVTDLPVTESEAVETAQRYLDTYLPGSEADSHADQFYGYYTLHILRDGAVVGMLSVNGYTGDVVVHSWHGKLISDEKA